MYENSRNSEYGVVRTKIIQMWMESWLGNVQEPESEIEYFSLLIR